MVTPSVRTYEGFTSPTAVSVNIDADGGRVVEYLYTRNSYTLSFNTDGGIPLNSKTLKYKEPIPTIEQTTKT